MKKIATISTFLGLAVLLSACTSPLLSKKVEESKEINAESAMVISPTADIEKPTPTLSKDNSIDSIEADLKATTVLEEDFSDIR